MDLKAGEFTREPPKAGLRDGGHVILSCSNCGQGLVDVWLTKPNPNLRWKGKAKCWRCGDQSFVKEWTGHYAPGHFGRDRPNDDPQCMNESKLESIYYKVETEGDTLVFYTKKAN